MNLRLELDTFVLSFGSIMKYQQICICDLCLLLNYEQSKLRLWKISNAKQFPYSMQTFIHCFAFLESSIQASCNYANRPQLNLCINDHIIKLMQDIYYR